MYIPRPERTGLTNRPRPGRPTGEMGAARAALGATIPPTPPPQMSQKYINIGRDPRGRPTGEMGAARAALGATIESENESGPGDARSGSSTNTVNSNRPLRFQESYLPTENGTRVISRPIQPPASVYSLRPGETVSQMTQRVDNELLEAVSRYPIFQNSLPKPPSPAGPSSSRPTRPMTILDEEVSRRVSTFPIFQQNNRAEGNMSARRRRSNEELGRGGAVELIRRYNVFFRRDIGALTIQRSEEWWSTRRPGPITPGFLIPPPAYELLTPPPAYEHAPAYEHPPSYDGVGESLGT
ncbi:hypothetical protein NHQ30_001367 [Ciborinia camelliae]|nr:hypothetical protein NHQ30_001367 [Ciborinia camelliae]